MTASELYVIASGKVYHIPETIVSFWDRYLRGEVEIYPPSDGWVSNMATDVAGYLRTKNIQGDFFQFCNKKGKTIKDDKYSTKLHWVKDEA